MALDKVTVGVLADEAVTSAKLDTNLQVDGTLGVTGNLTVTGDIVPATPLSNRNMIINGAMQISQRGTTTAPTPKGANDDGYYSVDRYRLKCGGTTPSRFNLIQESITDLAGFSKAMKVDCTTASASPGADDYVILAQRIEGFNLQQMEKGFSSAKPVTLSFWVKGTASRTYVVELRDTSSTARSASQQFTVTGSWVKHTYTFPGDTGGDKIPNDNTFGLEVNFWLHAGANFTGGTYTAKTWANHADTHTAVGISGSGAGAMQTTSDEFLFTGVQLELGSSATPFEHRTFQDELLACQRYYEDIAYQWEANFGVSGSGAPVATYMIPKRSAGTITYTTKATAAGTVTGVQSIPTYDYTQGVGVFNRLKVSLTFSGAGYGYIILLIHVDAEM